MPRRFGLRERGRYETPRGPCGGERRGGDRPRRSLSNGERDLRLVSPKVSRVRSRWFDSNYLIGSLISKSRRSGDLARSSLRGDMKRGGGDRRRGLRLGEGRRIGLLATRMGLRATRMGLLATRIGLLATRMGLLAMRIGLLCLLRLRRHRSPPSLSLDLSRLKRSALRDLRRGDLFGT